MSGSREGSALIGWMWIWQKVGGGNTVMGHINSIKNKSGGPLKCIQYGQYGCHNS